VAKEGPSSSEIKSLLEVVKRLIPLPPPLEDEMQVVCIDDDDDDDDDDH